MTCLQRKQQSLLPSLDTQLRKTLKNKTYYKELSVEEANEIKQATEEEAEEH